LSLPAHKPTSDTNLKPVIISNCNSSIPTHTYHMRHMSRYEKGRRDFQIEKIEQPYMDGK
jgi:hypothetical protein